MNRFKNNFWPRPRDENGDFLLTTMIEQNQGAVVTAMCVWNDRLIYATVYTNQHPRLFQWDGVNAPIEIAAPPWTNPPVGTFQINVMAVYNGQLWVATSPNGAAPVVTEIWFHNGTLWTDAKTLAGWGGAPLPQCGAFGAGWMFVFNNTIFVGQDTAASGINVQGWNGTTWLGAVELVGVGAAGPAAGSSTIPSSRMHAPILNNVVYVGAYDSRAGGGGGTGDAEVYTRTTGGTWTRFYTFPHTAGTAPTDPVAVLVKINNQIYAAHGATLFANNDVLQLACVTSVPTRVRNTNLGFLSGLTVAGGPNGQEVALFAGPRQMYVFDPSVGNLEPVSAYADDSPLDLVVFDDRVYVSQGSVLLMAAIGNQPQVSVRIARLD